MLQLEMQDGILSRAVMPQIKTKTLSDHTEPIGRGEKNLFLQIWLVFVLPQVLQKL